ncbi:MAG: alkaline phosphatase family protein [Bacillaceae bacterium]|nr:alkaline phosphatase family protein [Bacillaceae bacterium]
MKKVILLLIDSLMPDVLEEEVNHKTIPALKFLMERGQYSKDCVSVFPTMTASVDSSLLTGVYPDVHRIPGLIWFDHENNEIVNYINGWKCVSRLGVSRCVENILYRLNEVHLSDQVRTIFEELSEKGKTSASINAIIHRGTKAHSLKLPLFMKIFKRFRQMKTVSGPEVLTLGTMVETSDELTIPRDVRGIKKMLGINDIFASQVVQSLIRSGKQPDFILGYFPDNDHEIHKTNPAHAENALIRVDQHIQDILNAYGTWDEALEQSVFIIISDHGQTRIGKGKDYNIDLDLMLQPFAVLQLNESVTNRHELVVCNNERMVYLYPLKQEVQNRVIGELKKEARIDIIAWKENGGVRVEEGGSGKALFFRPEGSVTDIYGEDWELDGDPGTLDLKWDNETLQYGDYPDVLARLYGALYAQDAPVIVVTARPRFEFKSRYYPTHLNGGSHGSLHKYDSQIPLIIAGTDLPYPSPPRLVDMKQYVLDIITH